MLVPLLTLLIPVVRILPPAYKWRMRSKIVRWYKDLARLEQRMSASSPGEDAAPFSAELDRIEAEVRDMNIPPGYLDSVYSLRLHIGVVRDRLGHPKHEVRVVGEICSEILGHAVIPGAKQQRVFRGARRTLHALIASSKAPVSWPPDAVLLTSDVIRQTPREFLL